jgi:SAM-dependent methyltransferase
MPRVSDLAPGSILQRMFFRERVRRLLPKPATFLEIGAGRGHLSRLLLQCGHAGTGMDLNPDACAFNRALNGDFIGAGRYEVLEENFLDHDPPDTKYDLIFSCMVIEHICAEDLDQYFTRALQLLKTAGVIVQFVPASMKYWGIEDEIAGHFKRYTRGCFHRLAEEHGLQVRLLTGLTYPISNWLFPISNRLVCRAEGYKRGLPPQDRTVLSGNRDVPMKTTFPAWMKLFLNGLTLRPFHIMQKWFGGHEDAMVLYCELAGGPAARRAQQQNAQ